MYFTVERRKFILLTSKVTRMKCNLLLSKMLSHSIPTTYNNECDREFKNIIESLKKGEKMIIKIFQI